MSVTYEIIKKELSLEEAAKELKQFAELTAKHSQNWDNFQEICLAMLKSARKEVSDYEQALDTIINIPLTGADAKEIARKVRIGRR